MVFLAPYDGSPLARAALARARDLATHTDTEVVALAVVPDDPEFASERGWIEGHEAFDPEQAARHLQAEVGEIAPEATFRWEVPEDVSTVASTTTDIARTIRQVAHELDADVVFIGSENAGRVAAPVTSVGSPISKDPSYDVFIVRHPD